MRSKQVDQSCLEALKHSEQSKVIEPTVWLRERDKLGKNMILRRSDKLALCVIILRTILNNEKKFQLARKETNVTRQTIAQLYGE